VKWCTSQPQTTGLYLPTQSSPPFQKINTALIGSPWYGVGYHLNEILGELLELLKNIKLLVEKYVTTQM